MTDAQKSNLRKILMFGVPAIVLAIACIVWLFSGRYESTDNAYVKADKIMISPEISGRVISKEVDDNQVVEKGAPLFSIEPATFQIALDKANADLANVWANIEKMKTDYQQKMEEIDMAQSDIDLADAEFERAEGLAKTGAMSKSQLDEATRDRDNAHAQLLLLEREAEGIMAQLDGNPDINPEEHSSYKSAKATADKAALDLAHTKLTAPSQGIVGNVPNIGDYARASVPALSFVSTERVWVEANFKETQLEHMKPGQKVQVEIDTFSHRTWNGTVESLSPATGSEFSILPAQNATGNWVKVVQRLAVRIRIDDADANKLLRPGMSAEVKVDLQS